MAVESKKHWQLAITNDEPSMVVETRGGRRTVLSPLGQLVQARIDDQEDEDDFDEDDDWEECRNTASHKLASLLISLVSFGTARAAAAALRFSFFNTSRRTHTEIFLFSVAIRFRGEGKKRRELSVVVLYAKVVLQVSESVEAAIDCSSDHRPLCGHGRKRCNNEWY